MEKQAKERNYWPHGIVISIILIIIACAWTIKIALDNPVQMDSYYMEKYQDVDRDMHNIEKKQDLFFERFNVVYDKSKVSVGQAFDLGLSVQDKQANQNIKDATITLLITRPETNEFNQKFTFTTSEDGVFRSKNIILDKPGRWQMLAKIKYKEYEGFHKYEVFAVK